MPSPRTMRVSAGSMTPSSHKRAGIVEVPLSFVLGADQRLEGFVVVLTPGLAGIFEAVVPDLCQHSGGLFDTHYPRVTCCAPRQWNCSASSACAMFGLPSM